MHDFVILTATAYKENYREFQWRIEVKIFAQSGGIWCKYSFGNTFQWRSQLET